MDKDRKLTPANNAAGRPVTIQKDDDLLEQAEELAFTEKLFRNIFESASMGMALGLPDGTFARTNSAFDRMLGYGPGELAGVHRSAVTPPEDIVENEERYRQFLKTGLPSLSHEKRYVRKDGGVIWVEVNVSFIRDRDGTAKFSIIMARDITEHRQMEGALRESEEKYRALLQHAYDAILIADFDGNLLEVNKKAEDLLGHTKEELRGTNIAKIHPGEEHERVFRAFGQMVEGKTHSLFDSKVLIKDGKTVPVDIRGGVIGYGGRRVALAIFRDITDRKKIEKQLKDYQEHLEKLVEERTSELKESEQKYRDIFEDALVGIYQSTPEGRLLTVNPYFARLHGYESPEELVRSITDIGAQLYVEPEQRKDLLALMEKDGIVRNFEVRTRTRDGTIKHLSLSAHAVKDGKGKILRLDGVLQDITERKLIYGLIIRQRDLALKLAQISSLQEGLVTVLETASMISGMECGGIFLKNSETDGFDLFSSVGVTQEFQDKVRHSPPGGPLWSLMIDKMSLHTRTSRDLTPTTFEEGLRIISVMPLLAKDEVIGYLLMCSKVLTDIPEQVRVGLELIAAESGNSIARMQARQRVDEEMAIRRKAEAALEAERHNLREANAALTEANITLKVLLNQREKDRKELEEKFLTNVQQFVLPHVEKLRKSALDPAQQRSMDLIRSNLSDLVSPFVKSIRDLRLTQRQLEVAILIRDGKTTKDIAGILNISKRAVDIQRFLIRKKLGLNKVKINLQAYLGSLS